MSLIYDNLRALHAQTAEDGPQRPSSAIDRPPRRGRSLSRRSPEAVMFIVVGVGLGVAVVVGVWLHWSAPGSAAATAAIVTASSSAEASPAAIAVPPMAESSVAELRVAEPVELAQTPAEPKREPEASARALASTTEPVQERTPEPLAEAVPAVPAEAISAVTAAVTASAPSPAEVNRLRNRLVMAIDGQDDELVEATLAALRDKLGEDSAFYQRIQAFTWLRAQQWDKAEQAYDALLLQHGDDAEARFNSGRLALRRGDLPKAEQRLRPLQRHPDYRQTVASMLAELDRQQRHAQAVR